MKAQPYLIHAQLCTIYADKKLVLFQRGGARGGGEGSVSSFHWLQQEEKNQNIKKKQFP